LNGTFLIFWEVDMKKAIVLAASFALLFLGSIATAHAGTHVSFGFSFGVVPAVPYGYYYYPPYYYPNYYYYYPGPVIYPGYAYGYYSYGPRWVYAPRYYSNGRRYSYGRPSGNRRTSSGRWRY
jgi:hypothetical protein